jgi:hypothetical protein
MNDIGLGKSIYTKKLLDEFAAFQDSQGTRKAQLSLIDLIGMSFIPMYSVDGPLVVFLYLLLMVWGGLRLVVTIFLRVAIIVRYRGCGVWVLTWFWGTLFQLTVSSFNWIDKVMEDVGRKVGRMLDEEAG